MSIVLKSYAVGSWVSPIGAMIQLPSAINGHIVAEFGNYNLDYEAMLNHARCAGGPALRALSFHQRAAILKSLAEILLARKEELYQLSYSTGATRIDSWIDIEGGTGTLHSYASKGKRELPDSTVLIDGEVETLGKAGTFVGQHVYTSLQGAAVFINAFNFPVWGMLEKMAPALLAGVPAIVKPASATAYLTEAAFRIMIESGLLPDGALQLIIGPTGDLFTHLTGQDIVSFTGSADTAIKLQSHNNIAAEAVRFVAERDSLNAAILAPDAVPGGPEFDLFIKEVVREMTVKAGQKCTAIRRAFVPAAFLDAAETALKERLARTVVGDPLIEGVTMGALVNLAQREDVAAKVKLLASDAKIVFDGARLHDSAKDHNGAFMSPVLMRHNDPWHARFVHDIEPFGPVATLMPYQSVADAIALANRGKGSLVLSLFTYDPEFTRDFILGAASFHGRLIVIDRDCAKESTGHGSPLPVLVHGGPGRAGGGEELGGIRGVKHYMQRTAIQGSPATLSGVPGHSGPAAS